MMDSTDGELVRLSAIDKEFSTGTLALEKFALAVAEREFVSLLGPSGCGKSTALRLIAGLGEPSSGEVLWSRRPTLGFIFQEPTLMPWRTAAGNVFLPLQLAGLSRAQAKPKVSAALEQVGLAPFERAYPRQLSGGMRMRVSIARALVTEPDVLLMDEPFAALDEINRFKLNNDVRALWEARRLTAIFVTHSVFESVYLSSRIVVMTPRPGRVFADIPIDGPQRRDESFRTSPEFAAYCRHVSAALNAAMAEG
jgi:NitT/TauT family transport system ATP-binding protein